jgi:ATP-dependent DNA ligase
MVAVSADALPEADHWAFEPKFDGFRCLAELSGRGVRLYSRQQKSLTQYFPEIVAAIGKLDRKLVLDGELVMPMDGAVTFAGLQRRLHPGEKQRRKLARESPAYLVLFDILAQGKHDLRSLPYAERREILTELTLDEHLVMVPMSTMLEVAKSWLTGHTKDGIEGVVCKKLVSRYGQRGSWVKVRTRNTAEAIIGGVFGTLERPGALILGRHDDRGRLRVVGRSTMLSPASRHELGKRLVPAAEHEWGTTIWSGRFGQLPSEPVPFTPVRPEVVVELEVDSAFELGRWRHPVRFCRVRTDLNPRDLV